MRCCIDLGSQCECAATTTFCDSHHPSLYYVHALAVEAGLGHDVMIGQGGGHGRLRHNPALCHECFAVDGDDE